MPGVLARVDQHGGAEDGAGCRLSWQDQEMLRRAWMDTGLGRISRGAILTSPDVSMEDRPKGWLVTGGCPQDRGHVSRKGVMVLPEYSLGELLVRESSGTETRGRLQ